MAAYQPLDWSCTFIPLQINYFIELGGFQILGKIVAPRTLDVWKDCGSESWLTFLKVTNLIINGTGEINGQGSPWWSNATLLNHILNVNFLTLIIWFMCSYIFYNLVEVVLTLFFFFFTHACLFFFFFKLYDKNKIYK